MHCPECGGKTKVRETRGLIRKRTCLDCGHRFRTNEVEILPRRVDWKNIRIIQDEKEPVKRTSNGHRKVSHYSKVNRAPIERVYINKNSELH